MMCCQVKVPRAGASAELELYPVHVKLLWLSFMTCWQVIVPRAGAPVELELYPVHVKLLWLSFMTCWQVIVPRAGASAELELYPVHVKLLRLMMCWQVIVPRAGASAELELYPVHVKLLRYQLSGQRQPNANMFAGMVGSIGVMMSSKHTHTHTPRRSVFLLSCLILVALQLPVLVVIFGQLQLVHFNLSFSALITFYSEF